MIYNKLDIFFVANVNFTSIIVQMNNKLQKQNWADTTLGKDTAETFLIWKKLLSTIDVDFYFNLRFEIGLKKYV